MMKVEKVNYNSSAIASKKQDRLAIPQQPLMHDEVSFGAVSSKEIAKELNEVMPSSIKIMGKIAKNMGEVQNIIINAIGTAFVAPIFIKWNPLSKTDEDTRTYSAWRQPISAVLAVITQAGITAPFNTLITNMANSGYLGEKYNQSAFKDDKYLAKLIKRENKGLTKEQLTGKIQQKQKEQTASMQTSLRDHNTVMMKNYKGETVPMSENSIRELIMQSHTDYVKIIEDKKLELKEKTKNRLARSEYLRTNNSKAKTILEEIDIEINKPDTSITNIKTYLRNKIKSLKGDKSNEPLIGMLEEIVGRAPAIKKTDKAANDSLIKEIRNKTTKLITHTDKYKDVTSAEEVVESVKRSLQKAADELDDMGKFLEQVKETLTNKKNISVADIEKIFTDKLATSKYKEDFLNKKFADTIISKLKNNVAKDLKGFKQIAGIVVSCAILPFTCALLNWLYPKFMDAVFPHLSNKKHDNESSALVAKAPKKIEVK